MSGFRMVTRAASAFASNSAARFCSGLSKKSTSTISVDYGAASEGTEPKTHQVDGSAPGIPVRGPPQIVQSIAASKYCQYPALEQWKRRPHISEWMWPATESVLHSPHCWAGDTPSFPTARFRTVAICARPQHADLLA